MTIEGLRLAELATFCPMGRKIVNIRLIFFASPLFRKKVIPLRHQIQKATNMKKEEMERLTDMVAKKTASIVMELLKGEGLDSKKDDEYVDAQEAAQLLGVTPNYLRSMKNKFPHIKVGNYSQGRVLFKKSALFENYTK